MTRANPLSGDAAPRWLFAAAVTYLFRMSGAALLALPFAAAVRASGVTQFPAGDRALFEPGGALLLELVASESSLFAALVGPTLLLLLLIGIAGVIPEFLLLWAVSPSAREERLSDGARRALPWLVVLGIALVPLRALTLGLTFAFALTAHSWFESARDVRIADLVFAALLIGAAGVQLVISALRDLSSCALVERRVPLLTAIRIARSGLSLRSCGLYAASLGAAAALYVAGGWLTQALDVSRPEVWRAASVLILHQALIGVGIALRVGWLSRATRVIRAQAEAFL